MINIIVRVLRGFYNEESTAFHCGEPRVTCQPMQVARDSILTGFAILRWGLSLVVPVRPCWIEKVKLSIFAEL